MDEQTLFDGFHQALDAEPRPGASQRLRTAFLKSLPAARKRTAYRMRLSKMGLRFAAVLVAVVIVAGAAAAFLASHRLAVGAVPASENKNVAAYRAMVSGDYYQMNAVTSNSSCSTIDDTTCAAAIDRVVPVLQHWINDLNSHESPAQYALIAGQLSRHLTEVVVELNAAKAFQRAGNASGFDTAMAAAEYERAWVDPASFTLEGSYPKVTASFSDAAKLIQLGLAGCVNGRPGPADIACSQLTSAQACTGDSLQHCEAAFTAAETEIEPYLIALVQNPAPTSESTRVSHLNTDLASADTALLAIADAEMKGNSTTVAVSAFAAAATAASNDATALT
jgi:hypothetical protein